MVEEEGRNSHISPTFEFQPFFSYLKKEKDYTDSCASFLRMTSARSKIKIDYNHVERDLKTDFTRFIEEQISWFDGLLTSKVLQIHEIRVYVNEWPRKIHNWKLGTRFVQGRKKRNRNNMSARKQTGNEIVWDRHASSIFWLVRLIFSTGKNKNC